MKEIYFVVLTMYQLYVADTYANYIQDNYDNCNVSIINVGLNTLTYKPNGSIRIVKVPDLNQTFVTRIWQRAYFGGNLFCFSPLKKLVNHGNVLLFIFNDNEPITNKLVREVKKANDNKVIIIEEGIGIYSYTSNKKLTLKQKGRLLVTSILGSPMQYKAIGDNPFIDYAIVSNVELYKKLEKSCKQIIFYQNKEGLFSSSQTFLQRYAQKKRESYSADYIYLGQPFDEFGGLLDEEKECLIKLFDMVGDDKSVLIKPHPRDAVGKYDNFKLHFKNVTVVSESYYSLPAECIVAGFGAGTILSFNSSAGVNLANSFQTINCIFLYKTQLFGSIHKYWNKVGSIYDDDIFKSKNNNTFIPETNEELMQLLKQKNEIVSSKLADISTQYLEIDEIIKNC